MADLRMPRLNHIVVSGRIGNEIELKYTPKGAPVVKFAIAHDRNYKDESDQWQTVTSWIDCVAWNKWAEFCANNLKKGSPVIIEGRLETRNWTDQNNQTRKQYEITVENIQLLEWKPKEGGEPTNEEVPLPSEESAPHTATKDDVPF